MSIFVKEVVQGGKIDKQGMIKPHDQIIRCGSKYSYHFLDLHFLQK